MADRLARFLPDATRKSMERYGFAYAGMLMQWPAIAGADLARVSLPERIIWPRGADHDGSERRGRRSGGTLVIRVNGPMAVEIQHMTPDIIDRINSFYGYLAVASVKIVQGPLPRPPSKPKRRLPTLDAKAARGLQRRLEAVTSDELRNALARLGRGVLARRR